MFESIDVAADIPICSYICNIQIISYYIKLRLQILKAVIAKEKILGDSLLFSSGTISEVHPSTTRVSKWIFTLALPIHYECDCEL